MASNPSLQGRRVLITGAARGIGAALARRLHQRGARVAVAGLEPELLAAVASETGGGPWAECDVTQREQVEAAVATAVEGLGGLDVVVANAGVAAQMPIIGGNPEIMERTIAVNLMGVFYTLRAAAPHIAHPGGYALPIASVAAALHVPLLTAYNASKAGVEAMGNTMRAELRATGAKVGVAYFAELETDMTRRGFATKAAQTLPIAGERITPLSVGIDALERGIARRSRRVYAPRWVGPLLPMRMLVQPIADVVAQRRLAAALDIAREENAPLTTEQPGSSGPR